MTKKYTLYLTPQSVEHIKHIAQWYNIKSKGLGNLFTKELKVALAEVKKQPTFPSFRYDEVRYAIPQNFPYAAHCTIEGSSIIVHAVFGFSENPKKWKE